MFLPLFINRKKAKNKAQLSNKLRQYLKIKVFVYNLMDNYRQQQVRRDIIKLIRVRSLEQYIYVKIIVNIFLIEKYAHVRTYQLRQMQNQVQPIEIQLQDSVFKAQKAGHILKMLNKENIEIEQGKRAQTISIRQFDLIMFGSYGRYLLLKTCFLNNRIIKDMKYLFNQDSFFKIGNLLNSDQCSSKQSDIKRKIPLKPFKNQVFLISRKSQRFAGQKIKICNNTLIQLNSQATINISKFIDLLLATFKDKNINKEESLKQIICLLFYGDIFNKVKKSEIYLKLGKMAELKIQLIFQNSEYLLCFIRKMYQEQMEDCLEWKKDYVSTKAGINKQQLQELLENHPFKQQQIFSFQYSKNKKDSPREDLNSTSSNNQSRKIALAKQRNPNTQVNKFSQMIHQLQSTDIVTFRKNWNQLEVQFHDFLLNWNMNKYYIDQSFVKFVRILDNRNQKFQINYEEKSPTGTQKKKFPLYQYLFPKINFYIEQIQKKLQSVKKKQKAKKQQQQKMHILDKLLKNFLSEWESINKGTGSVSIKLNVFQNRQLKDFLPEILIYQYNVAEWEDVFNTITINVGPYIKKLQNKKKQEENKQEIQKHLPFKLFPTSQCVSCMEFFYQNTPIPRCDNGCIRLINLSSKIKQYEAKIKEQICSMLNNSGGVILFNCLKEYSSIYPCGVLTTQKNKEAYQNQILNLLNFIYPKPEVPKNIVISFVPVVYPHSYKNKEMQHQLTSYSGEDAELKTNQYHYNQVFIEGLYVLRIKVCPSSSDQGKVYIWTHDAGPKEDPIYHLSGVVIKDTELKLKKIRKAIKLRFQKYQRHANSVFKTNSYISPFCHICKTPSSGIKISQKQQASKSIQIPKGSSYQQQFSHASMVVVQRRYLKDVQQKMTKLKLRFHLQRCFQNYHFKVAQNTAILYHDLRFQELLKLVSYSSEFLFQGKMTLVIYITQYLKLQQSHSQRNRIQNADVRTIQAWLKREFPNENLSFYMFKRDQYKTEFYLKTQSKISALFIYYVLNHFKIKAIFKNPHQLDRMKEQERQRALIQIKYQQNAESQEQELLKKRKYQYLINSTIQQSNLNLADLI